MKSNNPYVNNLVAMGYDRQDCEMVAAAGQEKTFPCVIHGRTFDTKEQYDEQLAEYIAGLWKNQFTNRHNPGCNSLSNLPY